MHSISNLQAKVPHSFLIKVERIWKIQTYLRHVYISWKCIVFESYMYASIFQSYKYLVVANYVCFYYPTQAWLAAPWALHMCSLFTQRRYLASVFWLRSAAAASCAPGRITYNLHVQFTLSFAHFALLAIDLPNGNTQSAPCTHSLPFFLQQQLFPTLNAVPNFLYVSVYILQHIEQKSCDYLIDISQETSYILNTH